MSNSIHWLESGCQDLDRAASQHPSQSPFPLPQSLLWGVTPASFSAHPAWVELTPPADSYDSPLDKHSIAPAPSLLPTACDRFRDWHASGNWTTTRCQATQHQLQSFYREYLERKVFPTAASGHRPRAASEHVSCHMKDEPASKQPKQNKRGQVTDRLPAPRPSHGTSINIFLLSPPGYPKLSLAQTQDWEDLGTKRNPPLSLASVRHPLPQAAL